MMNMMNRMVEGRGHVREIDMLLELTYGSPLTFYPPCLCIASSTASKSRAEQSAPSAMPPLGPFRGLCATSVPS